MIKTLMKWISTGGRVWLKAKAPIHRHNFEMEFADAQSLSWIFRCACGETAKTTKEALEKMGLI